MFTIPQIVLNDGNTIPQVGLGTYQIKPPDVQAVVSKALAVGYRHIDTAEMYENEREIGEAISRSDVSRSEIFITSKLNNGYHRPADARRAFDETLMKLGMDYIDLFLIHWPLPTLYDGNFAATWKILEEFRREGRAKSIGVSNFQVPHLEELIAYCDVTPAVNQIELHPYFQNQTVSTYGGSHHIVTESWSPIGQGRVLHDHVIVAIAKDLGKTPAQVVLRWHIQHGFVVFPKSTTPKRIEENFAIFDFVLSPKQVTAIDILDKGEVGRMGPNPDTFAMVPVQTAL